MAPGKVATGLASRPKTKYNQLKPITSTSGHNKNGATSCKSKNATFLAQRSQINEQELANLLRNM
jgi:hypothetical protein